MHMPHFWATASSFFGVTLRYDQSSDSYEWHLVSPTGCTGIDPSVLVEFSEFRGRILYAGGRRLRFQREGMRYADEDSLDSRSFHITARRGGDLVGYTRIRPLPRILPMLPGAAGYEA